MNVLVCGGRAYDSFENVTFALGQCPVKISMIVQGGARGADALAKRWATDHQIHYAEVPALWDTFGKSAGFRRNNAMLRLNIGYCVAFPGGRGTTSMIELCKKAGVPVWLPYGLGEGVV